MNGLKKIWIWCCRFRKRKGYGVHSPFAFNLIRNVINERSSYYAYSTLAKLRKEYPCCPRHVDQLLFRLSNYMQPATVVQVGNGARISLRYLSAGCSRARCVSAFEDMDPVAYLRDGCWRLDDEPLDLLHITFTSSYVELVEAAMPYVTSRSLIIVERLHENEAKLAWWRRLKDDPRVGITFDLYEVGLVFFNLSRCKQHYVVNYP